MQGPDLSEIKRRAEAGDGDAQYHLAALLSQSGLRVQAADWLERAASAGHGDALYTLATQNLQSSETVQKAVDFLVRAAEKSSAAARLLSVLNAEGIGMTRNDEEALRLLRAASDQQDPPAMRETAMLIQLDDLHHPEAERLLARAAPHDPVAAAIYVRSVIDIGEPYGAARAQSFLQALQKIGYPNAASLAADLRDRKTPKEQRSCARTAISPSLDPLASPGSVEQLSAEPTAMVFRKILTPVACEYMIATAAKRLAPSTTIDPRTGQSKKDAYRTSLTATLGPVDLDLVLVRLSRTIAACAGKPVENGEFFSVLYYRPGDEYKPHYDWLPPGDDFDRGGQRVTTALVYLNDDYSGGETHFVRPDVSFRGDVGDLLVFQNAHEDGSPDKSSRHASVPVIAGAKWLASKWYREKNYKF